MAKSRETYSKKEKEKKRLRKKQEKQEKKEARKANSNKGDSFEDMLAYVDENGNITSTPPDPSKRKKVNAKDIEIGVSRQVGENSEDTVRTGTVIFFNESKGYGFINDQSIQENVFVPARALLEPIHDGDKVTFEVEKTPRGLSALEVKLLKE